MQRISNLKQKMLGSAMAGVGIFFTAYGVASGQFWLSIVGAVTVGYLLGISTKVKAERKASTISA